MLQLLLHRLGRLHGVNQGSLEDGTLCLQESLESAYASATRAHGSVEFDRLLTCDFAEAMAHRLPVKKSVQRISISS